MNGCMVLKLNTVIRSTTVNVSPTDYLICANLSLINLIALLPLLLAQLHNRIIRGSFGLLHTLPYMFPSQLSLQRTIGKMQPK